MTGQLPVELVEYDPRLHDTGPGFRIDRHQVVAVLRPVDDDRRIGALAAQTGAAAPGQHRRAELGAHSHRLGARLHIVGHDHTRRHLPVVRPVRGVGTPAPRVEPHLAPHPGQQRLLKPGCVEGRCRARPCGGVLRRLPAAWLPSFPESHERVRMTRARGPGCPCLRSQDAKIRVASNILTRSGGCGISALSAVATAISHSRSRKSATETPQEEITTGRNKGARERFRPRGRGHPSGRRSENGGTLSHVGVWPARES